MTAGIANDIPVNPQDDSAPQTVSRPVTGFQAVWRVLPLPVLCFALLIAGASWLLTPLAPDAGRYGLQLTVLTAVFLVILAVAVARTGWSGHFGWANAVTLFRSALILSVLAAYGGTWPATAAWVFCVIALIALLLDGLDGKIARARRESSGFGARFDMEVDAAFLMGLTILAANQDKAGWWFLLAGLYRYLFIAAGRLYPWINADLPDSFRRKVICVVAIATALGSLTPLLPPPVSTLVALVGLIALTGSFAIDLRWLYRKKGQE